MSVYTKTHGIVQLNLQLYTYIHITIATLIKTAIILKNVLT